MENQKKTKNTYTKDILVRKIAKQCNRDVGAVRTIYDALEDTVADALSSADSNTDVSVRLFEGIRIDSTFVPSKSKVNNLTGKLMTTMSKIKPKARITRSYCEKITNHN